MKQISTENGVDVSALMDYIPYAKFMGCQAEIKDGMVLTSLPFINQNVGNTSLPALHGGAIGSFLEITAVAQLLYTNGSAALPKTVSLTIDYLSSGKPETLYGRCLLTKKGRRVTTVRVETWQSDPNRLTASAHGNFLLKSAPK